MASPTTNLQVSILRRISPPVPTPIKTVYDGKSKLSMLLPAVLDNVNAKVVVDFGSGHGYEAIEIAMRGARQVIGVEIDETLLEIARKNASKAGVGDRCVFSPSAPDGSADVVVSLDSFEHFDNPGMILQIMLRMLVSGGRAYVSWGPPWYHPYGMHLQELYPWTHVLFSEEAVLRWRQLMRGGSDLTYRQIGLNQMTVRRFTELVAQSGFRVEDFKVVPIRPLRWIHNRLTREFTTSIIQCCLEKP